MCVQIEEMFCFVLYSRQVLIYHSNVSVQCYIISKTIKLIKKIFTQSTTLKTLAKFFASHPFGATF